MQIALQSLGALIIVLGIFQKEKWKMMAFYTINNIVFCAMYFSFGRTTTAYICIVATLRTFVFMIYAYKKLKPNVFFLILFESLFVAITFITWQDYLDLLPMFAILSSGFGSWQNNQTVLRVAYIINTSLYVIYKAFIGAYIAMIVEIICFICNIIGLIYYCILKKETPILEKIFRRKKHEQQTTV